MDTLKLFSAKTITAWDDGLPLGNGDIGCLVWNNSRNLRFSIDKAGIWDCSNSPEDQENFNYNDLISLISQKKQKRINKKYDDCYSNTTPTKLPTGKIILDLGVDCNVESSLNFTTAEAKIKAGTVEVKSFVHASHNFGLITVSKTNVGMSIINPKFGIKGKFSFPKFRAGITQSLTNLKYESPKLDRYDKDGVEYCYFIQPTNESYYGIVAGKKEVDGTTLIAYTVGIDGNGNFLDDCISTINSALIEGYEESFKTHAKWWNDYTALSRVNLPDKFLEKNWNLNNYLLGACSRKGCNPMPLQGVWTADNNSLPPWKGDYHHDLNTQMSYTAYLKSNRIEEGECFIDYLIGMSEQGTNFAKNFYNTDGICLPSVMDIKGKALGGWAQYALSPTNQLWLCHIMARHYFHTNDIAYLQEKIYPYMTEVGKFIMGMLKEVKGYYKLPLSSSPEINDNRLSSWLTPNSNYDQALINSFMTHMINLSRALNKNDIAELWTQRTTKLEPLAINSSDILMLCADLSLEESHRHFSHCMSIYPLKTLTYSDARSKKIIDSTIDNLEKMGIFYWVGYSIGWMANLYIIQGNGDKAATMLNDFFANYCTDNGFHVNGDHRGVTACGFKYRHFTLEGNFIALDGLNNMLMYSESDGLKLFPAIPKDWKNVSFDNLRGYGGILVSAKLSDGVVSYLKIVVTSDVCLNVINADNLLPNGSKLTLVKGETLEFGKLA